MASSIRHWLKSSLAASALLVSIDANAVEHDEVTRAAARQLAQDGARALEEGRNGDAQDLLDRAYQLVPAPTIALLEARALEKLGRLVEAAEHYEKARRTPLDAKAPDAFVSAVAQAEKELAEVRARIPQLTIQISGAKLDDPLLDVRIDGKPLPKELIGMRHPVDPGPHEITARLGSGAQRSRAIELAERQELTVVLPLRSVAAERPAPRVRPQVRPPPQPEEPRGNAQRSWGTMGLGVGAVGLVTGVIAGLVMLDKKSELDDACTPTCPPGSESDLDTFRTARTVSMIGYGVGFVGVAVGTGLLITAPRESAPQAGLRAPLGFSVSGSFD